MTSPALTIDARRPLQAAATLMVQKGVKRLPVTQAGRLVGIVTRADLVRSFLQTDEELAESVRNEVLVRSLWIDPADFDVGVTDGVVTIRGTVGRRSTAEMVPRFIRGLPGVVAVDARVDWEIDDGSIEAPAPDLLSPYEP